MPRGNFKNKNKSRKTGCGHKRSQRDWSPEMNRNHNNKRQKMDVDSSNGFDGDFDDILSISDLTNWSITTRSIVARIINIQPPVTTRSGWLTNVIIGDDHGNQSIIRFTLFDQVSTTFNAKFKIGDLVKISNWKCLQNLGRYNPTLHHFELHSTVSTIIEKQKKNDQHIPEVLVPDLVKNLKCIAKISNEVKVNCVGVIIKVGEPKTTQNKRTGKNMTYVDASLADQSTIITVRFWRNVNLITENLIGKVIICHSAKVNKWNNGTSLNQWNYFTVVNDFDGSNVQIQEMLKWMEKTELTDSEEIIDKLGCISVQSVDWSKVPQTTIQDVISKLRDLKQVQAVVKDRHYFKFEGCFKFIHGLSRTSEEWYVSAKHKNKKLVHDGTNWVDKTHPSGKHYSSAEVHRLFSFKAVIEDVGEGVTLNVHFFNAAAEQLLEIKAEQAYKMKSSSKTINEYKSIIDDIKGKEYEFYCTATQSTRDRNGQNLFYWNVNVNKIKSLKNDSDSDNDEDDDFETNVQEEKW